MAARFNNFLTKQRNIAVDDHGFHIGELSISSSVEVGDLHRSKQAAGATIAPGNSIGTLTVGNYISNGGTLEIESVLGGDASASDKLIVTGSTSGTTNVKVINVGGLGGQTVNGIKVFDVQGAFNGAFSLLGNYVFQGQQALIDGAYAYTLQKNGIANVYYEFLGATAVNVSGANVTSNLNRTAGGFGFGGSYTWDNNKYALFGEALVKTSFDDNYSVGGTAGFRIKW